SEQSVRIIIPFLLAAVGSKRESDLLTDQLFTKGRIDRVIEVDANVFARALLDNHRITIGPAALVVMANDCTNCFTLIAASGVHQDSDDHRGNVVSQLPGCPRARAS